MEIEQLEFDLALVDPAAAVRALRDAQYNNTGKAIAELIDNSIDAGASRVELLIEEHQQHIRQRSHWRVSRIAVVDNGSGMDPMTLVEALRIGGRRSGEPGTPNRQVRDGTPYCVGVTMPDDGSLDVARVAGTASAFGPRHRRYR